MLDVDDSLGIRSDQFLREEESESKRLVVKPRATLSRDPTEFNGIVLSRSNNGIVCLTQATKIDMLDMPSTLSFFGSQRAAAQYIGVNRRPDLSAAVQRIAPRSTPTTSEEFKALIKAITFMEGTKNRESSTCPWKWRRCALPSYLTPHSQSHATSAANSGILST